MLRIQTLIRTPHFFARRSMSLCCSGVSFSVATLVLDGIGCVIGVPVGGWRAYCANEAARVKSLRQLVYICANAADWINLRLL